MSKRKRTATDDGDTPAKVNIRSPPVWHFIAEQAPDYKTVLKLRAANPAYSRWLTQNQQQARDLEAKHLEYHTSGDPFVHYDTLISTKGTVARNPNTSNAAPRLINDKTSGVWSQYTSMFNDNKGNMDKYDFQENLIGSSNDITREDAMNARHLRRVPNPKFNPPPPTTRSDDALMTHHPAQP